MQAIPPAGYSKCKENLASSHAINSIPEPGNVQSTALRLSVRQSLPSMADTILSQLRRLLLVSLVVCCKFSKGRAFELVLAAGTADDARNCPLAQNPVLQLMLYVIVEELS